MFPCEIGMALETRGGSPNGSAPRCDHLDTLVPAAPYSDICRDCQATGDRWTGLVACLTCGWVACSDDSPRRHALAHYRETDHPVAQAMGSGRVRRWCYVHRRAV
jgi:uncharacterized UBP type Zn finger protein